MHAEWDFRREIEWNGNSKAENTVSEKSQSRFNRRLEVAENK